MTEQQALRERVVAIALENDGVFNTYRDKQELIDAGLLGEDEGKRSLILYRHLSESPAFVKDEESKGRWISPATRFARPTRLSTSSASRAIDAQQALDKEIEGLTQRIEELVARREKAVGRKEKLQGILDAAAEID